VEAEIGLVMSTWLYDIVKADDWFCVAGIFCAVVSHPADTIVSKLNQQKGSSFMQVGKSLGFLGKCHS